MAEAVSRATLPALAAKIAEWFPELNGRSVAVSDAEVTKENMPTLPVAMVALIKEDGNHSVQSNYAAPSEDISLEFWFQPRRYLREDGSESPFWAFYDYDALRQRLLENLMGWVTPRGNKIQYVNVSTAATQFAVAVVFKLRHAFVFCDADDEVLDPISEAQESDGKPGIINFKIMSPIEKQGCFEAQMEEEHGREHRTDQGGFWPRRQTVSGGTDCAE